MKSKHRLGQAQGQRGMAALVVVTVLFIVTSLVAAYTSRNLVFEQRTSANQYRSTQALEAAEAGIEWALMMLNGGVIDEGCAGSNDTGGTSFRTRYLSIDGTTGNITPRAGATVATLWPSCVFNGTAWTCDCPINRLPTLDVPAGNQVFPAFRVRFVAATVPAGTSAGPSLVRIESNGCTKLDNGCLNFPAQGGDGEGRATVTVLLALSHGVSSKPLAPLTVRGNVGDDLGFTASNPDVASGGIAVQARGTLNPGASGRSIVTAPGSPAALAVLQNDNSLPANVTPASLSAEHKWGLFTASFNAWANSYREQPATLTLDCGNTGCSALAVSTAALLNPGRPLWLQGHLLLDSAVEIGSANAPVILLVTGNATSSATVTATAAATINGLIYLQDGLVVSSTTPGNRWIDGAGVTVQGALVTEGNLDGSGSPKFIYDAALLERLRLTTGSFVRVPGGWRDF